MKKFVMLLISIILSLQNVSGQIDPENKLAHTYSIVARDPQTGEMGVAVQSNWFSVGSLVSWAEAGVGAIATQSFVNVSFGPRGLELLKSGKTAQEVLKELIDADEGRDVRQLAIVDAKGNVAAHTGKKCIPAAGHYVGDNFSVEANLMLNDKVWPAMAKAFQESTGPLAERMVTALEAAQSVGGDIRGKQSAAILVVRAKSTGKIWEDRVIDLRIEDHAEPIKEIRRLLKLYRAYEFMNKGDYAVEKNDMKSAMELYGSAEKLFPDNQEMKYWHAVALANNGMVNESLPIFREVFKANSNWRILTERLPGVGQLTVSKEDLQKILKQQ
ncbi:DUF1028 domain-containing protein [bacterium]|nr:DUF1028 domain-containing protein [bacterium]